LHDGVAFLLPLSYEVGTNEITQTLLIPPGDVTSISAIGVATDGSGMTTFLYFLPPDGFKGLDLLVGNFDKPNHWEWSSDCLSE
jgi:hypothetical protein